MSLWNGFPSHSFLLSLSAYRWLIRLFQTQDPLTSLIISSVSSRGKFVMKNRILHYRNCKTEKAKVVTNPEMMPYLYDIIHRVYGHMNYSQAFLFINSAFISIPNPNHNFCFLFPPTNCQLCLDLNVNLFSFRCFWERSKPNHAKRGLSI